MTVDVPANQLCQIGLSIQEPNAAGFVYPVSRDFGFFSTGHVTGGDRWVSKQYLIWPKTSSPMLLFTNEHPVKAALLGTVRVYRAHVGEEHYIESLPSGDHRIAAALVERPWLVESLGGREALDAANHQSVDDWQTFYDTQARLIDYLQLAGYNAAVLSAFADGSTIYPSELLGSTPRYDTGVLASMAQDPMRKDFLEMILRGFDRSGLLCYVGLEFSTPLPELERLRRQSDARQTGIEWIGPDGQTWMQHSASAGGAAPHYNLLNERVQDAMVRVVREVVARYGRHASLRGIGLQLSGHGYAQLVEPHWGLDDETVRRFTQDTGIEVPGSGPGRFAIRGKFLRGQNRKEWIAWRAQVVSGFYARLRDEVRSSTAHRELLLLPARLFDRREIRMRLRPSLAAPVNVVQVLLELGIDVEAISKEEGIVFLRPTFETPLAPLGPVAVEHQVSTSSELDAALSGASVPGSLVFFPSLTRSRRLLSFDQQSPFGEDKSFTAPLTQLRPLGNERRRALARALAGRDSAIFVEGGQTLVTELDEDLRRTLAIFRKLPTANCKTSLTTEQPVTVRTYHTDAESFICVVNESPWPQSIDVSLAAPPGVQLLEIGTARAPQTLPVDASGMIWPVELAGYGVRAARMSTSAARVMRVELESSAQMETELARSVDELEERAMQIKADRPFTALQNSGFELDMDRTGIAGWQLLNPQEGQVELDSDRPQEGNHSLRITSTGLGVSVASHSFRAPATGRLALDAYVRRSPESRGVSVLMVLEDAQGGTIYRRGGVLGKAGAEIAAQWKQRPYRILFDDVPIDTPLPLRVRFEVAGAGTVWVDGVQLADLGFRDGTTELQELAKIVYEANRSLEVQAYSDCLESLEGYWARYLTAHVEVLQSTAPVGVAPAAVANAPKFHQEDSSTGVAERIKQYIPRVFQR
jgi:hypothetical protein